MLSCLYQRIKQYKAIRQQQNQQYVGPLFKNPATDDARHLIERAGMRGRMLGPVQVSSYDPNYLINLGGARATAVIALMTLIHRQVLEQLRINLAVDIEVQGAWEEAGDHGQSERNAESVWG